MLAVETYDAIVLGSGEGGKYIAWHLASSGSKVAVVERRYLGGSCPNIACLPSKNIIHSAKIASMLDATHGAGLTGKCSFPMSLVESRKNDMMEGLRKTHLAAYARSGAELIWGSGRFIAPKTIEVNLNDGGTRTLRAELIMINTGTHAKVDHIPGLMEAAPLTHVETLDLTTIPEHLVILGGGYVGLEFAQAMRRLGSRVTIIERNSRLLHREDPDISDALHRLFEVESIELLMGTVVSRVSGASGNEVLVEYQRDGATSTCRATHLLVATGRIPNTHGIGLELAGIRTTETGFIQVNERLETTAPGVWALGECAGSPQFTHVSYDDFRVVRDNLAGKARSTANRLVPSCLFTDPELARVGLTETEAKERGIAYRLVKLPAEMVLRTRTLGETTGFIKALIGEDDRILGFVGFITGAGELMGVVQLAMVAELPYSIVRDTIFAHPTFSEGLVYLFGSVH